MSHPEPELIDDSEENGNDSRSVTKRELSTALLSQVRANDLQAGAKRVKIRRRTVNGEGDSQAAPRVTQSLLTPLIKTPKSSVNATSKLPVHPFFVRKAPPPPVEKDVEILTPDPESKPPKAAKRVAPIFLDPSSKKAFFQEVTIEKKRSELKKEVRHPFTLQSRARRETDRAISEGKAPNPFLLPRAPAKEVTIELW